MVITSDFHLPSDEELTVPEVNLSSSTLRAGAFHLGKYCEQQNNEFMLCRAELNDPRACIKEGKEVTACTLGFFRQLKKHCLAEFTQYATCIDKSSGDFSFTPCRKTQGAYDACVLENLKIERPEFGYFCRVRVHDSPRPRPEPEKKHLYEDATPKLPEDYPRTPAKYGSRHHFVTE